MQSTNHYTITALVDTELKYVAIWPETPFLAEVSAALVHVLPGAVRYHLILFSHWQPS